jgi:hypothetical protein
MVDNESGFRFYVIIPGGKSLVLVNEIIFVEYMKRISKIYNTGTPLPNIEQLKVISNDNNGTMHEVQGAGSDKEREGDSNIEQQAHDQGAMPRLRDNGVQDPGESVEPSATGDTNA